MTRDSLRDWVIIGLLCLLLARQSGCELHVPFVGPLGPVSPVGEGLMMLVVEEADEEHRSKLSSAQWDAMFGTGDKSLRSVIEAKSGESRVLDRNAKDKPEEYQMLGAKWRKLFDRAKTSEEDLPWLSISNGRRLSEGKMPESEAGIKAMAARAGVSP